MSKILLCDGFPEWALDYAINGEVGDLTDHEKDMVDYFLRDVEAISPVVDKDTGEIEHYFDSHPAFGKPCLCVDVDCLLKNDYRRLVKPWVFEVHHSGDVQMYEIESDTEVENDPELSQKFVVRTVDDVEHYAYYYDNVARERVRRMARDLLTMINDETIEVTDEER